MNKEILNKDVVIENGKVVITENVKTTLDKNQLDMKLRDIQMNKSRIQEQNTKLVKEYNALDQEEIELQKLVVQLTQDDIVQII